MNQQFTADFFKANRDRLRQTIQSFPAVIAANGRLQKSGDDTFPFKQDANFWYLTGIDLPDFVLVMTAQEDFLILPSLSAIREFFDGAITGQEIQATSGIQNQFSDREGFKKLGELLAKQTNYSTVFSLPTYLKAYGLYVNPARRRVNDRLRKFNKTAVNISLELARLRTVKQPVEVTAIQKAIDATADGLNSVFSQIKKGELANAHRAETELNYKFSISGNGHAFWPIIASGAAACTLHNLKNNAVFSHQEMILFDVGAEYDHYAADISRTKLFGKPTARQQDIYDAVIDSQNYAFSVLKPGVYLKQYEKTMEKYVGRHLTRLGIIDNLNSKTIRQFFPHATSHFLGLNLHDAGDYQAPLKPGTVMTVEPGIYIPSEGLGVRVEDDVIITDKGIEILSANLSRALN